MNIIAPEAQTPASRVRPTTTAELIEAIEEANGAGRSYEIVGGGTKRTFGDPVAAHAILDLSGINGIEMYEPEELVIKVRAGTPVGLVRDALAKHGQHLAFEPPDYARLFGNKEAHDGGRRCRL